MKTKINKARDDIGKNLLLVVGVLCICAVSLSSVEAKGLEPSVFPLSADLRSQINLTIPSNAYEIKKRVRINNSPKSLGKKPTVNIVKPGGQFIREIEYYNNAEIVIPLSTSHAKDSIGNALNDAALSWSYNKNSTRWIIFGNGRQINLKLRPDSTIKHSNIYRVDIRVVAKDPINGSTAKDNVILNIQAIAK